jgi:predicted nucleic acid-binding protein
MPAISNTSPVILLAKIGRLKLIKDLYKGLVITPFVKRESVDKGKELGAMDVREIEDAIKAGWIKVTKLNKRQSQQVQMLVKETKIGFGEAETLVKSNQ